MFRQAQQPADGKLVGDEPEHYLNEMESQVEEIGMNLMRHLLIEQWKLSDEMLVEPISAEAKRTCDRGWLRSFESCEPSGNSPFATTGVLFASQ